MSDTETREREVALTVEEIIKEAKRLHENCLHTSKSHFVSAQFWNNFHLSIGIPTVILAGIAGVLAFASFEHHDTFAGVLAVVIVVLTAVTTFLNPKERSGLHLNSGNNYDSLLTKARIFWTIDCKQDDSEGLLTDNLKKFTEERDMLNRDAPQPSKWAYKKAKKGIEAGEADYLVDKKSVD